MDYSSWKVKGEFERVKRGPLAWSEACGLPNAFLWLLLAHSWARTLSLTLIDSQEFLLPTYPRTIFCWCLRPCEAHKVWSHGKKIKFNVSACRCLLSIAHLIVYFFDALVTQNPCLKLFTLGKVLKWGWLPRILGRELHGLVTCPPQLQFLRDFDTH